jgi:hypothetical protein
LKRIVQTLGLKELVFDEYLSIEIKDVRRRISSIRRPLFAESTPCVQGREGQFRRASRDEKESATEGFIRSGRSRLIEWEVVGKKERKVGSGSCGSVESIRTLVVFTLKNRNTQKLVIMWC